MWCLFYQWRWQVLGMGVVGLSCLLPVFGYAIEVHPSIPQIQAALDRGHEAGQTQQLPDTFYARFGATDEQHPGGFVVTKLGGLSVLATHMGLRGLQPSQLDVTQILENSTMLVSIVIVGEVPHIAVDSYIVLEQGTQTIKPVTIRFDGVGTRSAVWPKSPKFKAKIIASFNYADFNPDAQTTVTVFPASGDVVKFKIDFSKIP